MTFDNMCKQSVEKNVKILPVYVVGWELKECSDINEIPFKRFQMEKYQNRKPKFDIPGMCLPLVRMLIPQALYYLRIFSFVVTVCYKYGSTYFNSEV